MNRKLQIVGKVSRQFLCKKKSSEIHARDAKSRNKENKQLFGPLVETQKQKRIRLKVKQTIPELKNNEDTEIKWLGSKEGNFEKTLKVLRLPRDRPFFSTYADRKKIHSHNNNNNSNNENKNFQAKGRGSTGSQEKFEGFQVQVGQDSVGKDQDKVKVKVKVKDKVKEFEGKVENLFEVAILTRKSCSGSEIGSDGEILSISAPKDSESLRYPSVTRILNASMSEEAKSCLENWRKRMIEELGQDGFDRYQTELLSQGKLLHSTIQDVLLKKSMEIPETVKPAFDSVRNVLGDVDYVKSTESHVIHRELRYRGFVDCVASYRGELCVIDWKKSDRLKSSISHTYDAPLQIAAYIGALNSDENYPFTIKKGLLVVGYTTGKEATVHELPLQKLQVYWTMWLKRLQKYLAEHQPGALASS